MSGYGICHRYQQWRGDRLVFSCECVGSGCPFAPTSSPAAERGAAGTPGHADGTESAQDDSRRNGDER